MMEYKTVETKMHLSINNKSLVLHLRIYIILM